MRETALSMQTLYATVNYEVGVSSFFSLQLKLFLLCQLLAVQPQGVLDLKNKPTINLVMVLVQTPILQYNCSSEIGKQLTRSHSEFPRCSGARKSQVSRSETHSLRCNGSVNAFISTTDEGLLRTRITPCVQSSTLCYFPHPQRILYS